MNRTKRARYLVRAAILIIVLIGWFTLPPLVRHWIEPAALAAPMTFVVNTTFDANNVVCSVGPNGCTLRDAINAANANPGIDTINFNIPGAGLKSIHLEENLPTINDPVIIDGYTQGVAHPNTLAVGNDAVLLIELEGSTVSKLQPLSAIGLHITAGGCTVKGLVINRFSSDGIFLSGAGGNVI